MIETATALDDTTSIRMALRTQKDVPLMVRKAKQMLVNAGFEYSIASLVATAVSELSTNVIIHAGGGQLTLSLIERKERRGFEVIAEDEGPGISDIKQACTEGFSTAGSLGLGLAGVQRIMDEVDFDLDRTIGTRVRAIKWK